ncbi:hypothetical protein Dimus_031045 [Dionaea muscipula]
MSEWLDKLLSSEFSESCEAHQELKKNMFCVDCNSCLCKHCVTSSCDDHHRHLQICKYVYRHVVHPRHLQDLFDCSKIQTYKTNGERAIHLNPRTPPSKDSKQSKVVKGGTSCIACGSYIQDLPNEFCSLACKVSNERRMLIGAPVNGSKVTKTEKEEPSDSLAEYSEMSNTGFRSLSRRKKRKRTPHRAPLF